MITANSQLVHADITHEIIGAFYDVFNALGFGFVESVYANALPIALTRRGLGLEREKPLTVQYRGVLVGSFRADLLVEDKVIVEIKVADHITGRHERQTLNYLRASGIPVGLILNFGAKAETCRMYWSEGRVRIDDEHG